VHLPLGLALLMPALASGLAWALFTGRVRPRAWVSIVALQAALLGAGLVAMNTGQREEDRVEAVVPHAAIERHEAYAEQFVWAAGLTLVPAVLVLVFRTPGTARALAVLTVAASVAVTAAAIRVGHAGGQLVYTHHAASAYGPLPGTSAADAAPPAVERDGDDDR
jgi:hypothetical protein